MSFPPRTRDFFVTGGAVPPNAPSYVERSADDELLKLIQAGHFSYVLTSRQMGKTSLMHRTAQRLKEAEHVRTARIDLTSIGTASVEEWYLALLAELTRQLRLSVDLKAWWTTHAGLGAVTRFTNFIRDVLLSEIEAQVVIFIDEIDFTLSLGFSDEFFAAIRAFYNARAQEKNFNRLTFVLLGVATPPDLIKDRTRTPFHIGEGLILPDFSLAETKVLQNGLENSCSSQGNTIFRQIYQWTDGHPYLTQTLCKAVVKAKKEYWSTEEIDKLVEKLFFSKQGQGRREDNLQFVQDRILTHPQQRNLLKLYRKVYDGEKITDDAQSIAQNQLKLSGLVKVEESYLQVRNNVYRQVFDLAWVNAHTTRDWTPIIASSAIVVVLFLSGLLAQSTWAGVQADNLAGRILQSSSATEQMTHLADLFRLQTFVPPVDYDYKAKDVFYSLRPEEQLALFNHYDGPEEDLIEVINGLYTTFADINEDNSTQPVLKVMQMALIRGEHTIESTRLEEEISHWLEGLRLFLPDSYNKSLAEYNQAIDLNNTNPATLYERARLKTKLSQYEAALDDLDTVMTIALNLSMPVNSTPTSDSAPTSANPTTVTGTPNSELLTPAPLGTTNNTVVLTPIATISVFPNPTSTFITAQFDTPDKIRSTVRAFIQKEPSLLQALLNASNEKFMNLK